jgi:hypothetical protein
MKHVTGMCGIGNFMGHWRLRDSASCTRYADFEEASQVLTGKCCESSTVWEKALQPHPFFLKGLFSEQSRVRW